MTQSRSVAIHDFVLDFVFYYLEFWRTLDSLILDLDMISIKYISIYIAVLMRSISRIPRFWRHPSLLDASLLVYLYTCTNLLH